MLRPLGDVGIKIDPKEVEFLYRANQLKNIKVTPHVLDKLKNNTIEEVVSDLTGSVRAGKKRPATSIIIEPSSSKMPPPRPRVCAICEGLIFRVIDNNRPDGRLLLECMRRECMATLDFASPDMAVGTVIGAGSLLPNSYRRDASRTYYPSPRDLEVSLASTTDPEDIISRTSSESNGNMYLPAPGQIQIVRIV